MSNENNENYGVELFEAGKFLKDTAKGVAADMNVRATDGADTDDTAPITDANNLSIAIGRHDGKAMPINPSDCIDVASVLAGRI